jgi:type I restriction enzyme S subunit
MRAWQGAIGAVSTKGMVSPAYVVARPKKTFDSNFFEYQYRTETFIKQMDRSSKGITDFRKRLYWNEFKQLVTILPPPNEQQEISRFISTLNAKTDKAFFCKECFNHHAAPSASGDESSACTGGAEKPALN